MSTNPQVKLVTVDSTGNTDEMSLETLVEMVVAELPSTPTPAPLPDTVDGEPEPEEPVVVDPPQPEPEGAVEKQVFLKLPEGARQAHTLDAMVAAHHFVNTSKPADVTLTAPGADYDDVVSGQIEVEGKGELKFTHAVIWHTIPRTSGPGIITFRRSRFAGKDRWRLWWSPEVAV